MKKIFTFLTASIVSLSLFAFAPQTSLMVSARGKNNIDIVVDGKNFTATDNSGSVVINGLSIGTHNIRIYQQRNTNSWYDKKNQLFYDGNVYIKPQTAVTVIVGRNGRAQVQESVIARDNDHNGYDNNGGYYGNHNNSQDYNGGWNHAYPQAMNDRTFDQFRYSISNTSFDNSKVDIAKQGLAQNNFTAAQVREIVSLFSFDNSKLEVARYAYGRTIDKENFFIVNDLFSFSSTKQELARYIQRYQ